MKSCKQCGTCCRKGGPALHIEDFNLLDKKILPLSRLITIRKGEPVFSPLSEKIEPAKKEFIKVSTSNSWICPFLDQTLNHCNIYHNRPIECRLLQCWDTTKISKIIYKDNLDRWDIVSSDKPIFEHLKLFEIECDFNRINSLANQRDAEGTNRCYEQIKEIIETEMTLREEAIKKFELSLSEELFYFGRPIFTSLKYWDLDPDYFVKVNNY